ncbi:hypothetical protein IPM62_01415 [Candidatus Woesebacteria bacterium]|nr:MAG: hypothetical protein IPM62_01415 [Candidatus Woesebacteria bacterium]
MSQKFIMIVVSFTLLLGVTLVYFNFIGGDIVNPLKVDNLYQSNIATKVTPDAVKGTFVRFENDYLIYLDLGKEEKILTQINTIYIDGSMEITKAELTKGDILIIRTDKTVEGELTATVVTRYTRR